MKLADISTGPDCIIWVVFAIFALLAIVLLSGHGSWLIAGYNMASKEEKAKFNARKLCRITGIGMAVIAVTILIAILFQHILPASFAYIMFGIIIIVCLMIVILANTFCRKE